jgi:PKD repeat protein
VDNYGTLLDHPWFGLFPRGGCLGFMSRRYGRLRFLSSLGLLTLFSQLTCGGDPASSSPPRFVGADELAGTGPFEVLVGSGNVARCDKTNDEATAALLDNIAGTVFMAGDGVYATTGVLPDYVNCYGPSWGRHKGRTRPAIGSLDPWSPGSATYWDYWGAAAGERNKGYYSFNLGFWHIVFLNSNLTMTAGSAQEQWLRNDLATSDRRCTVAIFHHPRFSSANGVYDAVKPAWDALYETQAEVIINAHYGTYERFAPQRPDGTRDDVNGIREFVAGLGGITSNGFGAILPNSEVRDNATYGVLKLKLYEESYDWEYIPIAGKTFRDSGTGPCRGPAAGVNQPPVANPGGPYTSEGAVVLNGSASSDPDNNVPLTYAWDFGDGSTGSGVSPSHTYGTNGTFIVSLTVTDNMDLAGNPVTTTATIANLPPVVSAGPDVTVFPAQIYALNAAWSDPNSADNPWTYTIEWGDGTSESGTKNTQSAVTGGHGYAAPGTYTVRVTVTDKDGGVGTDELILTSSSSAVFVGNGNIAACNNDRDEATAVLLDGIPGQVFTTGDNVFPDGTISEYNACYQPTWGRHKLRTRPVPGNHDYNTPSGAGYFAYWGSAAGETGKGWYTYTLGAWRVIVLNDQIAFDVGSEQYNWLNTTLNAMTERCTIAMFHVPRFLSSNEAGYIQNENHRVLWERLYEAGVDIVLNGQQHHYERFRAQTPAGAADDATGIRQFNLGTGGESAALPTVAIHPNSQVRATTFGVVKFTLNPDDYSWQFIPMAGQTLNETGSGTCHDAPDITNAPPTAVPGGPYSSEATVVFNGTGSSDPENHLPLSYAWNFGDGTVGTGAAPSHAYSSNGSYTASLVVTDVRGAVSAPATTTVTIGNIAPTVSAGAAASLPAAAMFSETATFSDPNPADGPWSYTILWGDGTSESGSKTDQSPITGGHGYATEGSYTLRVNVTDKDGGTGTATRIVTVTAPVILAAGDIADCTRSGDEQTANVLDGQQGVVLVLGDNAYSNGTLTEYQNCYEPNWGRHKSRTRPVPGNHDYNTPNGAGYYAYYGAAAGDPSTGYYTYSLGNWFIIALNSNLDMFVGSAQEQWLRQQLVTHATQCVLAYWHYPRWSTVSGRGTLDAVKPLWDALYEYGADIILNGHDHAYQRFIATAPDGTPDPTYGIPQFAVGTGGGEGLYQFGPTVPILAARNNNTFGVIKMTLRSGGYDWQFLPVAGGTFTDAGSGNCHTPPPSTNLPPNANPGGPYTGESSVSFTGTGSSDPDNNLPLSYDWNFGDGSSGTGATPSHIYASDGAYSVTLRVFDNKGAPSQLASTTATIANVPPAVNAGADFFASPGQTFNLTATFTDPGGTPDAPWSYTFAWGDGASESGSTSSIAPLTRSHSYPALGDYTVRVTMTDKDGGIGFDEAIVHVANQQVLVGAGNIARCDRTNDEATAALLDGIAGTVFTAGDGVQSSGGTLNYAGCYGPSWGRHLARTRPTFGSQDTWNPATYYSYYGSAAGPVNKGYYSYDLGDWHIIVLNSAIAMTANSVQELWLKSDLQTNTRQCIMAMWHHPRFTSAATVDATSLPVWNDLYAAGADVIVNAHYGVYERFAPQSPTEVADPTNGIRQFVIGTAGISLDPFGTIRPNSQVRRNDTYGVLKFTLTPGAYSWQFVPVAGKTFTDTGSGTCH